MSDRNATNAHPWTYSSSPARAAGRALDPPPTSRPDAGDDEMPPRPRRKERTTFPGAVAVLGNRDEEEGTVEYSINNSVAPVSAHLVTSVADENEVSRLRAENQLLREREQVLSLRLEQEQMQHELEQMRERDSIRDQEQEAMHREQEAMQRKQEAMRREREEMRREQEEMRRKLEQMSALLQDVEEGNVPEKPHGQESMGVATIDEDVGDIQARDVNEELPVDADTAGRRHLFGAAFFNKCADDTKERLLGCRGWLWSTRPGRLVLVACLILLLIIAVILSVMLTQETPPPPLSVSGDAPPCDVYTNQGIPCFRSHEDAGRNASTWYANNQNCTFRATVDGYLDVRYFNVEYSDYCNHDSLTVVSTLTKYCGSYHGPYGVEVNAGDTFVWSTNHEYTRKGFDVCLVNEPPPPPPPGVTVTGGECVVDVDSEGYNYCLKSHADVGNSDYSDNQNCVFTINIAGVLDVRIFDFYGVADYLYVTISGVTTSYYQTSGPDGVMVNPGDQLVWHSDSSNTDPGFDICIV